MIDKLLNAFLISIKNRILTARFRIWQAVSKQKWRNNFSYIVFIAYNREGQIFSSVHISLVQYKFCLVQYVFLIISSLSTYYINNFSVLFKNK